MSKAICIMGESGSGKTTSLRTLPPKATFYVDADGKGLSWRGWRDQYNGDKKNYYVCDDPEKVLKIMHKADKERPEIKYFVIDTLNGIMIGDEMRRCKEKGFDKWQDLAQSVYMIVNDASRLRDDLTVILLAHTETIADDAGYTFTHIRTNGKKLNKISLESKLTTVLLAKCVDGQYLFETQSRNSTAKSPMGAIEEFEIENDIMKVITALKEF